MSKKHLTYDDRLAIQAGLQKGLKVAQIAKNIGKDRATIGHELIRYVIPKNQAQEHYTEEEIREMMNHINSYPRKKWNGQAPIDLFVKIYGQEAAELLGLRKIPSDSIHLTPALLKK